jgi:hypothetical protein
MYATTRYNFVRLKATHKFSPLEELVGGDLPPSSSQRLTGMGMKALIEAHVLVYRQTKTNMLILMLHETILII